MQACRTAHLDGKRVGGRTLVVAVGPASVALGDDASLVARGRGVALEREAVRSSAEKKSPNADTETNVRRRVRSSARSRASAARAKCSVDRFRPPTLSSRASRRTHPSNGSGTCQKGQSTRRERLTSRSASASLPLAQAHE